MDASTTAKLPKIEQCRKNAQAKSEQKRQATFAHELRNEVEAERTVKPSEKLVQGSCLAPLEEREMKRIG